MITMTDILNAAHKIISDFLASVGRAQAVPEVAISLI